MLRTVKIFLVLRTTLTESPYILFHCLPCFLVRCRLCVYEQILNIVSCFFVKSVRSARRWRIAGTSTKRRRRKSSSGSCSSGTRTKTSVSRSAVGILMNDLNHGEKLLNTKFLHQIYGFLTYNEYDSFVVRQRTVLYRHDTTHTVRDGTFRTGSAQIRS